MLVGWCEYYLTTKPTNQQMFFQLLPWSTPNLKVAEVTDNVSIFLLVTLVLEPENWRDEVREAQELGDDGISSRHYPEDGLAAQVVLCQEVHHCSCRRRRRRRRIKWMQYSDTPVVREEKVYMKTTDSFERNRARQTSFIIVTASIRPAEVSLSKALNASYSKLLQNLN